MGRTRLAEYCRRLLWHHAGAYQAFAEATKGVAPRKLPEIPTAMRLSGLEPLTIDDNSLFVNVGERNNVTGSAKFKAD